MRQESVGVTENLLESAKKEFMSCGFHNASLRKISADSGVSTNSIYTRFGDKAGLFSAIVKPAADGLMELYLGSIQSAADSTDTANAAHLGDEGTDIILEYIYGNFDAFRLIFCYSAGTEYENYFDKLAETEEFYYRKFAEKYGKTHIDDFFIHVVCRTGWQYIYEAVSHGLSFEEAKAFMQNIKHFCFAGWKAVLGIE